jgi:hypothetical protein
MLLTFIFTDESRFVLVLWVAGIRSLSGGHGSSIPSKSFSENWPPLERTSIHSFISLSNLASTGIIFNWKLNHPFYLACQKAWPKESKAWTRCSSTQIMRLASCHKQNLKRWVRCGWVVLMTTIARFLPIVCCLNIVISRICSSKCGGILTHSFHKLKE